LALPELAADADDLGTQALRLKGVGGYKRRVFLGLGLAENLDDGLDHFSELLRDWNRCLLHG
jgi:hypothetical protein